MTDPDDQVDQNSLATFAVTLALLVPFVLLGILIALATISTNPVIR